MKHSIYTIGLPLVALAVMALLPDAALAGDGLQKSVGTVKTGIQEIPIIISGIAYILGAAMIIAGAYKLRAHVENPLQEPIQKGIVRIAIGAVLAALPALMGWATKSLSVDGTFAYKGLEAIK